MTTKKEQLENEIKGEDKANWALACAIIGIFCFAIVLEPIAICLAISSRKLIGDNSKSTAAQIIAIISICIMVIYAMISINMSMMG